MTPMQQLDALFATPLPACKPLVKRNLDDHRRQSRKRIEGTLSLRH